jgi:hypothetical protein
MSDDNEFKCVRRIASKLGLAMPESDDGILCLRHYVRIDRAIKALFTECSMVHEKCKSLECDVAIKDAQIKRLTERVEWLHNKLIADGSLYNLSPSKLATESLLAEIKGQNNEQVEPLTEENGKMRELLRRIKTDLLMRGDEDSDGCTVVDLSSSIWLELCKLAENK